ncbi:MAG: hypothetical protein NTW11_00465 [Candidatus Staskawiczbacteria bacterium]|nr:hypothetical protein [Candidatus Staskawiczbacteria bacterium]
MKQGLFEVFGSGKTGLKAEDLNCFAGLLAGVGILIPEGIVLATDIFDRVAEKLEQAGGPDGIGDLACPQFLVVINEEILGKMEIGRPYAVRSSALSECGGTGIYQSAFFVPTGKKEDDLESLWQCERCVYASEFSTDAKLWRERSNAPMGMAVLIQLVIGTRFEDGFLPPLAGVAYTSYNGLPTVRAVIGLGTQAVNGGGIIFNIPVDHNLHFQREMWELDNADAIDGSGVVRQIGTHQEDIYGGVASSFELFNGLFGMLARLQKQANLYLEWVISDGKVYAVQCAVYEDKLPGDVHFDSKDYFLLFKGSDVVHAGKASCKSVVYVHSWSPETASVVESLNETMKDFLLVVPQDALSLLADLRQEKCRLSFKHFSNALAVVEKQRAYTDSQRRMMAGVGQSLADHSSGRGASHFSQLCSRTNILFIGGEFDSTPLLTLPGGMDYGRDIPITIWNTAVEVVVDGEKEGCVYVSKNSKRSDYSLYQLQDWSDNLRTAANSLSDSKSDMTNHFYAIHYAIAPDVNPSDFDPYALEQDVLNDFGGIAGIIASLDVVIANGEQFVDCEAWNGGLKEYLEDLRVHLKQ